MIILRLPLRGYQKAVPNGVQTELGGTWDCNGMAEQMSTRHSFPVESS